MPGADHAVLLMSRRVNAPYSDEVLDDGSVLIYEGHDVTRSQHPYPKQVDQPKLLPSGKPTENGKFLEAVATFRTGRDAARRVRVYEKIKTGIWAYNGLFHLTDAWTAESNKRQVFKFKLLAVAEDAPNESRFSPLVVPQHRLIPTAIKREVWKRDGGRCARCGSDNDLHFDHVIPFSLGGSSTTPENVQLLCARHNLEKRDRIE